MKTSKHFILSILLLFCIALISSYSQTTQPSPTENSVSLSDQVKLKIGGFIKSDLFYDSRKTVDVVDGLFLFYPSAASYDSSSGKKDINAVPLIRMSAVTSRLSTKFTGPDAFNAKTTGYIEFDFSGFNSIGLRLRHAYMKLNWTNDEIMFGRFWHPLFITDAFPTVLALNTGAPFSIFNRTEQLRYTHTQGSLSVMVATTMQYDYSFPSKFDSTSAVYFSSFYHNSVIPDFNLNLQYKSDLFILGATGNYKINQPKISTKTLNPPYKKVFATDEKISSMAISGYGQVKVGLLKIKGSVMYGENMREFLLMGGYAIDSVDVETGKEIYTPMKNMFSWINIIYGDALQGSIFIGYEKNLGAAAKTILPGKKNADIAMTSRGYNIDKLIRLAPMVSYKTGKVQFFFEVEHTIASYGTIDPADYGKVKKTKDMAVTRVQFSSFFYF
jgi:hypothetical protein